MAVSARTHLDSNLSQVGQRSRNRRHGCGSATIDLGVQRGIEGLDRPLAMK